MHTCGPTHCKWQMIFSTTHPSSKLKRCQFKCFQTHQLMMISNTGTTSVAQCMYHTQICNLERQGTSGPTSPEWPSISGDHRHMPEPLHCASPSLRDSHPLNSTSKWTRPFRCCALPFITNCPSCSGRVGATSSEQLMVATQHKPSQREPLEGDISPRSQLQREPHQRDPPSGRLGHQCQPEVSLMGKCFHKPPSSNQRTYSTHLQKSLQHQREMRPQ